MTNYRQLMLLLLQQLSYREIATRQGCSQRTIAKTKRVLEEHHISETSQVEALTAEEIDSLFSDGRKAIPSEFVPIRIDAVLQARIGRKKPPLKVLWAKYLRTEASSDLRHYSYERFCQIIAEHVRVNDLTAPISHVPGHTMQVDWAGTKMCLIDPISKKETAVSIFVASLPFSGMVFAYGYLNEKQPSWLDAHKRAFQYFGGVSLLVVPDNASTASNQIGKHSKAREVNQEYAQFLEHYETAAVPTRSAAPRDKGNVEAGVKVVTNWVIHYLAGQVFASLDDLNEAVAEQVQWINNRTPFRGDNRSRQDWFHEHESSELLGLPEQAWEPVVWRKSRVHRDWHIQIDTIKYSVPYEFAGLNVDVRIVGTRLEVLADGEVIATHQKNGHRNGYVTNPEHAPAYLEETTGLWTRAYFLRQAAKAGPATVTALEKLLDGKKIEAQGFRACMNILDLGKRGNRQLLEQACKRLTENDTGRQISYTSIKHAIAAIRAEENQRPSTASPAQSLVPASNSKPTVRDTSRAHLSGPAAFSLETLMSNPDIKKEEGKGNV